MSEMPKLPLTPEQHAIAKMLKSRYGFKWPFAAHIAKDITAMTEIQVTGGERDNPYRGPDVSWEEWRKMIAAPGNFTE